MNHYLFYVLPVNHEGWVQEAVESVVSHPGVPQAGHLLDAELGRHLGGVGGQVQVAGEGGVQVLHVVTRATLSRLPSWSPAPTHPPSR